MEELLDTAISEGVTSEDVTYIKRFIENSDYIAAAEFLERSLHTHKDVIRNRTLKLAKTTKTGEPAEPNTIHYLLTRMGFSNIVTTNYDTLLEEATQTFKSSLEYTMVNWKQASHVLRPRAPSQRYILKLHGSVNDLADVFVLSRSAYLRAYRDGAFINHWLRASLTHNSFLIIGSSLNDYDILGLFREARSSIPTEMIIGPHFAVLDKSLPPMYAAFLKECYSINTILIEMNSTNVHRFLTALHGRVALKQVQSANFTLLPASYFAKAIKVLCEKIKQAMGVDQISLYMVDKVDSRILMQWLPASHNRRVKAPDEVSDFFLQMRDINYCYLSDHTRDASNARKIFSKSSSADNAIIVMPVASQGKKWGILVLTSRIPNCLTDDHLKALRLYAKSIADTYIECSEKIRAVSYISKNITFDFVHDALNTNRIVKHASASNELDYIIYTIDYLNGELIAHCDSSYMDKAKQHPSLIVRDGKLRLPFDGKYLALKAMDQGTSLRYISREQAEKENPDYKSVIRETFDLFKIKGNLYISPVRSFGYISAILAAWNKPPCTDGLFHSTVFDRVKRFVRVLMNDYTRSRDRIIDPKAGGASKFIKSLDDALAKVDLRERWGNRIHDPRFQKGIIDAILRTLTHPSTSLMKVRLWVRTHTPARILDSSRDLSKVRFVIHSSFSHTNALFDGLPNVDGYANEGIESIASDRYTQFTLKRFALDPYARFQKPRDFGDSPDGNAGSLHKDPSGEWLTAPIVWRIKGRSLDDYRSGDNARLLGFLSADSHRKNGDGRPEIIDLSPEEEAYQRCVMDLASHLLAPIVRAIVIGSKGAPHKRGSVWRK